ncbi:MAG: sporulation integral membrane protein YlbJ [Syntrophomonadaceae bacterium]|nr:sporulation integral membrane protein YlbJ [Syntrophomonadaceae bacterium]MDD3022673.1 sporulation integral membrane protein YlbJ [Syntrophomonadaceae bacterium]
MNQYSQGFFLIIILILSIFMIINPSETVTAASNGFNVWYMIIVPALLPFFIVAELLVSLGFVNFLGVILEPVMRPLFKLPGCSALVITMGFTSGFPMGAILSKKLYDEDLLTGEEAERLVSFTNNSSPLFIIGAVGVGMFTSPCLGYILAASHYLSNLLLGILWRFRAIEPIRLKETPPYLFKAAWNALQANSNLNRNGFGKILGDAIKNSLNNILAIAGFIIIFSVFTRMFAVWGFMDILAAILAKLFSFLELPYPIAYGMATGMFEISIGSKAIITAHGETIFKLLAVSSILAFSGFSIIAQVMGIVAGIPVRISFYLLSRLLQILISGVISLVSYSIFVAGSEVPSFSVPYQHILYSFDAWSYSLYCLVLCLAIIGLMILLGLGRPD